MINGFSFTEVTTVIKLFKPKSIEAKFPLSL